MFRGADAQARLNPVLERIKRDGKNKPYDCVIGLSGGVDSTYVAYLTKKVYGLRPLAVHLDNGWNSEIAVRNIHNSVEKLGLDLDTNVLDWDEFRALQVAFLRASTPDSEIPTDHAIVATLFRKAIELGAKVIVDGSNYVTEAMMPVTWSHGHADWHYIKTLNDQYGGTKLKSYPHYTYFDRVLRFPRLHGVRRFSILNYVEYDKPSAMRLLTEELGWVPYGGKHYESIYTRFYQGYILPEKFGFDKRRPHLSCLVRGGQMTREEALEEIVRPAIEEGQLVEDRDFVVKKLSLTPEEFEAIMCAPKKTFWDYESYERQVPQSRVMSSYTKVGEVTDKFQGGVRKFAERGFNKATSFGVYPGELHYPRWSKRAEDVSSKPTKTACIISLTPVTDEPRVRRQASALLGKGWRVVVVGRGGGRSPTPEGWELIEVENRARGRTSRQRRLDAECKQHSRWIPRLAERYYWRYSGYDDIYEAISHVECDLVLANDYFTMPIAARLADKNGVGFAVDCHEYARGQYMHDERWVREERPWIDAIQKTLLPRAAAVTTVCEGIAERLGREYELLRKPSVVRSVPPYSKQPFRPTGDTIEVLYHGIIAQARGLEPTIESVALWRPEFRLIIRGRGPDDYMEALRQIARRSGVEDRVELPGALPFEELIPAANRSDIGYFVQADISEQKRFALPNKFFEYIMAGMALCVAHLPEMARVVNEYDVGRLVRSTEPEAIAKVINSFTPDAIDACKRRSLEAAKELCWDVEAQKMLSALSGFDSSFEGE